MRVIRNISYRHIAGYLSVVGHTRKGALQNAKKVGTSLLAQLPETLVRPARFRGQTKTLEYVYEVPVLLGKNPQKVRRVIATLMLADLR